MDSDMTRSRTGRVRRTYVILIPTLIALWFLAGIDHNKHQSNPNPSEIFWIGFGIVFAATVIFSVVVIIRFVIASLQRRRTHTGGLR